MRLTQANTDLLPTVRAAMQGTERRITQYAPPKEYVTSIDKQCYEFSEYLQNILAS